VVWNLVANAVKFTPEGGVIDVSLRRAADGIQIEVQDHGPGIDQEFLPHIFEAFRQFDSSTTRPHGGLGLGLSIARRIVELHGGSIAAANRRDASGAVFTVMLPALSAGGEAIGKEMEPAVPDRAPHLGGLRVLLVDDEADAREVLATALTGYGARVVACRSAAEALDALHRDSWDVLVSDIAMPGEDGYGFIARVRADPVPAVAGIPAIVLTAYAQREDIERARRAGYQMHLAKPLDAVRVANAVQRLGNSSRSHEREQGAIEPH
jgi:CheY-like chemotaxis protein